MKKIVSITLLSFCTVISLFLCAYDICFVYYSRALFGVATTTPLMYINLSVLSLSVAFEFIFLIYYITVEKLPSKRFFYILFANVLLNLVLWCVYFSFKISEAYIAIKTFSTVTEIEFGSAIIPSALSLSLAQSIIGLILMIFALGLDFLMLLFAHQFNDKQIEFLKQTIEFNKEAIKLNKEKIQLQELLKRIENEKTKNEPSENDIKLNKIRDALNLPKDADKFDAILAYKTLMDEGFIGKEEYERKVYELI